MDKIVAFGRTYLIPGSPMLLLIGLAVGLVLAARKRTMRLGHALLWGLLGVYLVLSLPFVSAVLAGMLAGTAEPIRSPEVVRQSEAIVLIGCGTLTAGSPGELVHFPAGDTALNISEAVRLYRLAGGHTIVATGGMPRFGANLVPESEVLRDHLLRMGVEPHHVVLESQATNTLKQARNVATLLPRGARVVLVTVPTHMPRTAAFFRAQGLQVTPAFSGMVGGGRELALWEEFIPNRYALRASENALYEVVGMAYYWIRGDLR